MKTLEDLISQWNNGNMTRFEASMFIDLLIKERQNLIDALTESREAYERLLAIHSENDIEDEVA